jgi:hypothetical protein
LEKLWNKQSFSVRLSFVLELLELSSTYGCGQSTPIEFKTQVNGSGSTISSSYQPINAGILKVLGLYGFYLHQSLTAVIDMS